MGLLNLFKKGANDPIERPFFEGEFVLTYKIVLAESDAARKEAAEKHAKEARRKADRFIGMNKRGEIPDIDTNSPLPDEIVDLLDLDSEVAWVTGEMTWKNPSEVDREFFGFYKDVVRSELGSFLRQDIRKRARAKSTIEEALNGAINSLGRAINYLGIVTLTKLGEPFPLDYKWREGYEKLGRPEIIRHISAAEMAPEVYLIVTRKLTRYPTIREMLETAQWSGLASEIFGTDFRISVEYSLFIIINKLRVLRDLAQLLTPAEHKKYIPPRFFERADKFLGEIRSWEPKLAEVY